MKGYYDNEGYYRKLMELQEKLRRSEEERMKLEEKFNKMIQNRREEEQLEVYRLKKQYCQFLEDEKLRNERNDQIIRTLDRIEYKAAMLTAKTDRLRILRSQYETCVKRSLTWNNKTKPNTIENKPPTREISYDTQQPTPLTQTIVNPFQSKFYQNSNYEATNNLRPSTSYHQPLDGNNQYYPYLTRNIEEQNIKSTYLNKQDDRKNLTSIDNNGSKIISRFTPSAVQENPRTIQGRIQGRFLDQTFDINSQFREKQNDGIGYNARYIKDQNQNVTYPTKFISDNDKTGEIHRMEENQINQGFIKADRRIWSEEDKFSMRQNDIKNYSSLQPTDLPNISGPQFKIPEQYDGKLQNKEIVSSISKPPQQFIESFVKPSAMQENSFELQQFIPSVNSNIAIEQPEQIPEVFNTNILKEVKKSDVPHIETPINRVSKNENTFIVDETNNDPNEVEILNNAYDGYYADEAQILSEKPESTEHSNQPFIPETTENEKTFVSKDYSPISSNIDGNLRGQNQTKELNKNQNIANINEQKLSEITSSVQNYDNYNNEVSTNETYNQEFSDQNEAKLTKKETEQSNITIDNKTQKPSKNMPPSSSDENYKENVAEAYDTYENTEQVSSTNDDNYESNQKKDLEEKLSASGMNMVPNDQSYTENIEPVTSTVPDGYNEVYDNQVQENENKTFEGYENYDQEITNPEANVDEMQAGYEPETSQLPEEYENYNQPEEVTEDNYEPGVNINQIPEAYGSYEQQDVDQVENTNTIQYEGYDENGQQIIDPNNTEDYDNGAYDENSMQPSEIYNEELNQPIANVDSTAPLPYSEENQIYDESNVNYDQNQEYLQSGDGNQDGGVYQDNGAYQDDGVYQDGGEYQDGGVYQDGGTYQEGEVYQEGGEYDGSGVYQENVYNENESIPAEQGQIDYSTTSNNENQEDGSNYVNQNELQNEAVVEKLTSNVSTILDSDTSEQQSSDQQQLPSAKDESDFDFSEAT